MTFCICLKVLDLLFCLLYFKMKSESLCSHAWVNGESGRNVNFSVLCYLNYSLGWGCGRCTLSFKWKSDLSITLQIIDDIGYSMDLFSAFQDTKALYINAILHFTPLSHWWCESTFICSRWFGWSALPKDTLADSVAPWAHSYIVVSEKETDWAICRKNEMITLLIGGWN